MKPLLILPVLGALALAACKKDETLSGYGAADAVWELVELDGKTFTARATLTFPEEGKLAGQAPCNRYFAEQSAPYPWFKAGPIGATRMACADLDEEQRFLGALAAMTLSEVSGDTLILSNDTGREMVFRAAAPDG